jgi:putative phosphoribosyl transferase
MHFVDRRDASRQLENPLAHMRSVDSTVAAAPRSEVVRTRQVTEAECDEAESDEFAEGRPARIASGGSALLTGVLATPRDPVGAVMFAYGSGTGTAGMRNQYLAQRLYRQGMATLLLDVLTEPSSIDRRAVFDIGLLGRRLLDATEWLREQPGLDRLPHGYFGAGTGAAAAVWAAGERDCEAAALVLLSGRPDLAGSRRLAAVAAPTLLIVGARDAAVLDLNRRARLRLRCVNRLLVVPSADHRFTDPRSLAVAARLAEDWFTDCLTATRGLAVEGRR